MKLIDETNYQRFAESGLPDDVEGYLQETYRLDVAGSDRASQKNKILQWLRTVPELVHESAGGRPVRLGLKLFNALFDDEFQMQMFRTVHAGGSPWNTPSAAARTSRCTPSSSSPTRNTP